MDKILQELTSIIELAEEEKRLFVTANPKGTGDREKRLQLYGKVEKARKALREYKRMNPHLFL